MTLLATDDLMGDLLSLYPNDPKSSTKGGEYSEQLEWIDKVRRGLGTGVLPCRKRNGNESIFPNSNEGRALFRRQLDTEFSNGKVYVDVRDVVVWLKGFRYDADAFAAKYGVDDATLPVARKPTAPVETPAPATGGTVAEVALVSNGAPGVAPKTGIQLHTETRPKRAKYQDLLASRIEDAQKTCGEPFNAPAVWGELVKMTEKKTTPLHEVTDEGLRWLDGANKVQFFTLKNLRDRLRNQKNNAVNG